MLDSICTKCNGPREEGRKKCGICLLKDKHESAHQIGRLQENTI